MAEAMEAAHERGIIHRDGEPSESPTMSAAATGAGVIMGTAAYMSPEQARGKPVDRRAGIWAFGAVLYEVLTGRRAFEAEDVSLTLAEVMKSEPNWDALPSDVSPTLRTYLARCLKKDPKERVRDIGDVRLALEGAFEISAPASDPAASKPRTLQWIAAVVVTGLVAGLAVLGLTRPAAPRVVRLTVSTPPSSAPQVNPISRKLAISSDGEWLVYKGTGRVLHVRLIDRFETTRLDVVNPNSPFVSPDGTWIRSGGLLAKSSLSRRPSDDDLQDRGRFPRRELEWGWHDRLRHRPHRSLSSAGPRRRASAADEVRRRQPPVAGNAPGQWGGAFCDRKRRGIRHRGFVTRDRRAPRADSWRLISPLRPHWASRVCG
ncbi:MAG: hypothetical protein E2P02_05935 [Acidobacteria bacterium]|nr:MAG: hypothetical protein E2P02_05935 [Acidobacteriota bacterium]